METEQKLEERIARARELLQSVRHVALATVNEDGSPHNSVVLASFGKNLAMYWASSVDTLHSRNIERTGQVFIVLFDSMGKGGGLYLQCSASVLDGAALDTGLAAFNAALARLGRSTIGRQHCTGGASQRLYCAQPKHLWVNMSYSDSEGRVLRDERVEIWLDDVLGAIGDLRYV